MTLVNPRNVVPSQDFLKEKTIRYILECMKSGDEELLPPPPIVRRDQSGNLVAIDGHNLLACRAYFNQAQHVHIATSADDKLTETSEADILRNKDLKDKFETSITERDTASESGIRSFDDLIEKYSELFESYR